MDYNYRVHKHLSLFFIFTLLITGCNANLTTPASGTPTAFIITATLPPSALPASTGTLPPPTPAPTTALIEGAAVTQLNVRPEPSTAGEALGMIESSAKVQIIGKDPSGNWYEIVYAQGPDGKGWVTAQYVDVQNKDAIPAIGGAAASGSGPSGVVLQQVNVRSGPGTDFDALGTLNPKDVVRLTGKDSSGTWFQIQYAAGPDGKGWVTAAYLQASDAESLPIIGQTGEVVGTGTPTGIPPTITPTLVAAAQDGDTAESPAVDISFSPTGARSLMYSSDVSSPEGDSEDWIQFTPYGSSVSASLTCTGNGSLVVELWQNGAPSQNWDGLDCGEQGKILSVRAKEHYLIRVSAAASDNLAYVHFTLAIETIP